MKRMGSNPDRDYGNAQHRSEEWVEDPAGRIYDDDAEVDPFEGEDEEEDELDEDDDEDDDDDDDEYEEEKEEEADDF